MGLPHGVRVVRVVARARLELPDKATLGDHLKHKRLEEKLLQREVAEQLLVSEHIYHLWENDKKGGVSKRYYKVVSAWLGFDVSDF
jgi:hypothetical protein